MAICLSSGSKRTIVTARELMSCHVEERNAAEVIIGEEGWQVSLCR